MDAILETPVERPAAAVADSPLHATLDLAEARRRRQIAMSRWENEGGSISPSEPRA